MAVGLYFVFSFLVLGILTVVLLKWLLKRWFRIEKTGGNFNREFYLLPKYGKLYTSSYEIIAPLIFTSRTLPSSVILLERIFALCSLANGAALLRLDFAFTRHVLVFKASIAKHVLMSREATVKSSQMYHFMKKWLGNALISSDHYKWIDVRKKLQPTLHKKVIESYFPIFYENSLTLASKLESLAGQKVDIIPILGSCTLDALVETSTGIKMGIQKNEYSEYLRSINTLTDFTLARIFKPWYWFDSIFNLFPEGKEYFKALKYSKDFSMKVIEERKRTLVASKTLDREQKYQRENESVGSKLRGISFLDMVLEMHLNDKTFTLLDVQEQVEGLLLGGYETSSLTMSYTLFLLGLDPTRLGKVQEELDAVLGTNPDYPVELERVKELSYLECVIKEASRLYPVAPFIARTLQSDLRIDDLEIPKGTSFDISILSINKDPDVYPDPEKFIPERFMPDAGNPDKLDPFAFLTFSAGPRNCPGFRYAMLIMKVILSTILRRFSVESIFHRDKLLMGLGMLLKPTDGLPLIFRLR